MKRNLRSTILAATVGAGMMLGMMLAAGTASAGAIVVPTNTWFEFSFGGAGSDAAACTSCVPSSAGNSVFLDDSPWTFDLRSWTTLSVTDAFLRGDQFDIFDDTGSGSVLILSTSVVGTGGGCGSDPVVCFADALVSSGTVGLAPGAHSLSIVATVSPFGGGAAFFRVPEPATLTLFAFGLLGLGFMMRRRRKTV